MWVYVMVHVCTACGKYLGVCVQVHTCTGCNASMQASQVGEWKSDGHMRELGRIVVLYGVPAFAKPWEEEGRKLGGFNLTKWLDLACTQVLGQY